MSDLSRFQQYIQKQYTFSETNNVHFSRLHHKRQSMSQATVIVTHAETNITARLG